MIPSKRTLRGLAAFSTALGVVGLAAISAASCNVYDASLLLPADTGPSAERGAGIGFWSGPADQPSSCFSARYPRPEDRPAASGGAALAPIFLGLLTLNTGTLDARGEPSADAWRNVGFDLDGTCTGSETCDTGGQTPLGCKPVAAAVPLDGAYCRDNNFGKLSYLATTAPETSEGYGLTGDGFSCALCVGAYNYLFRLTGYNGEANDDSVRVDLYPSPGLDTLLPWDCKDKDWKKNPCFLPDDKWQIREDVLVGAPSGTGDLPASKLFDANAYVRENTLVVTLPDNTLFWFPGERRVATAFPVTLRKGVVSAKIERGKDGIWRATDGIIAGRTSAADVLKGFRLIGVCENDKNYPFLQDFISKNVDVLANGDRNPDLPCDAISVGMPFTAIQATPGRPTKVRELVECQKPGSDAGADTGAPIPDAQAQDAGGD